MCMDLSSNPSQRAAQGTCHSQTRRIAASAYPPGTINRPIEPPSSFKVHGSTLSPSLLPSVPLGKDSPERGGAVDYRTVNGLLRELAAQREERHGGGSAFVAASGSRGGNYGGLGNYYMNNNNDHDIQDAAFVDISPLKLNSQLSPSAAPSTAPESYDYDTFTTSSYAPGVLAAPRDSSNDVTLLPRASSNAGTSAAVVAVPMSRPAAYTYTPSAIASASISIDDRGMKRCRSDSEDGASQLGQDGSAVASSDGGPISSGRTSMGIDIDMGTGLGMDGYATARRNVRSRREVRDEHDMDTT